MLSSLVGSYIALQINAKAMVAEYADSPILALAKALGTQKYVALVEKVRATPLPAPRPVWFRPNRDLCRPDTNSLGGPSRLVLG